MSDDTETLDEDFDPNAGLAGPLMKKVLAEVGQERKRQDGDLGLFRDYPDGTAGRALQCPTISRDKEAAVEAQRRRMNADRAGKTTWRHQLDEAHADVVAEGSERHLRRHLVRLAAQSVSWVEAIDRRSDEKRIAKKVEKATHIGFFERFLRRFVRPGPF